VACPAGSFKAVVGPHALNTSNTTDLAEIFTRDCQQCPAGKFSPAGSAECTSCRDSCDDGFIVNGTCAAGAAQDAWCTPCPQHTYRDSSAAACIACDPKSRTLGVGAPAATSCKCIEGYTIVDTFDGSVTKRTCQPCPVHTFSLFGEDYCSPCDSNAQAPAQSTSSAACQCNAGYTGANGARCRACASGRCVPFFFSRARRSRSLPPALPPSMHPSIHPSIPPSPSLPLVRSPAPAGYISIVRH